MAGNNRRRMLSSYENDALIEIENHINSKLEIVDSIKVVENHWGGCQVTKRNVGCSIRDNHIVGLGLHNSRLKILPESIADLMHLENLELGCNQLRIIPDFIGDLKKIKEMNLVRNQIQSIPEVIGNLNSLEILNLGDNDLSFLPDSIGNLSNLIDLKLFSNEIEQLPESIGDLKKMESLNLYSNHLTDLPSTFGQISNLKILRLSSNYLKSLPESFGNLEYLEQIHLRQNLLEQLPESFGNLKSLQFLNLWKNSLRELPASFAGLSNLRKLELRGNKNLKHNLIALKMLPNLSEYHLDKSIFKSDPVSLVTLQKTKIGTFEIISGLISVIDPWIGRNRQLTIHTPKGKWYAYYIKDQKYPSDINSLLVVHERFIDRYIFPDDWLEGHLRIDSKQCGIYDDQIIPDADEENYDLFYNENEIITTDKKIGLFYNYGVVTSTPRNDIYPVFSLPNDRGFIVAIWIIFSKNMEFRKFIKF